MPQAFRIFWKDTRHLWPEILVSIAITASFVATEPWDWAGRQPSFAMAKTIRGAVLVLLPVTWALLVARSVQDESLVGTQQVWLTRPYHWPQLLMSKLLFMTVYIGVPMGVAKIVLLHMAATPIMPNLSAVLINTACTVFTIGLLYFALASITANFIRFFFTALGFVSFVALVAFLDNTYPGPHTYGPDMDANWPWVLILTIFGAVVIFQFARRRSAVSRWTMAVLVLISALVITVSEHLWTPHRAFRDVARGEAAPLTISANLDNPPEENEATDPLEMREEKKKPAYLHDPKTAIRVTVPLRFSATDARNVLALDNVTLWFSFPGTALIKAGDYLDYTRILPGRDNTYLLAMYIDKSMYDQYASQPVSISATIAATTYAPDNSFQSAIQFGHFPAPDGGFCVGEESKGSAIQWNKCMLPLGRHITALVTTNAASSRCDGPTSPDIEVESWVNFGEDALSVNYDPLEDGYIAPELTARGLAASAREWANYQWETPYCPATPVTFIRYHLVGRTIQKFSLPPMRFTKGQKVTPDAHAALPAPAVAGNPNHS